MLYFSVATMLVVLHFSISISFFFFFCNKEGSGGHIVNNRIVIHHLIMIWQMLAPSPFSASSSLSILRSAKLSRTPPVGLIRAVCLCEAAGALRAAGARHCQWTESLTLPGSRTQTHAPRSPCYCFHLNPFLLASLHTWVYVCAPFLPYYLPCLLPRLSPLAFFFSSPFSLPPSSLLSIALHPCSLPPRYPPSPSHSLSAIQREGQQHQEEIPHKGTGGCRSNGKAEQQDAKSGINQLEYLSSGIWKLRDCIHFKTW